MSPLVLLFGAASAQGLDATGPGLSPTDGDTLDPLVGWRAEAQDAGELGAQVALSQAGPSAVLVTPDEGAPTWSEQVLLGQLTGLDLGVHYGVARRAAVAVRVPLWLRSVGADGASGPALGDVRLSAPVGLVLPSDGGFSLSIVPSVALPSGPAPRWLGSSGFGGSAALVGTYGQGPFQLAGDLGVEAVPAEAIDNLKGGPRLTVDLDGAYAVTPDVAVHAGIVYRAPFAGNDVAWTAAPAELLVAVRGRSAVSWTAGGSAALTGGVGAATWRLFAGVGLDHVRKPPPPPAPVVVAPPPPEPAPVVVVTDLTVTVVDAKGAAVADARVDVGPKTLSTGADGTVTTTDVAVGAEITVSASTAAVDVTAIDGLTIASGHNALTLTLRPPPKLVIEDAPHAILHTVWFELDQSTLTADAKKRLDEVAASLKQQPRTLRIEVQGYADETGSAEHNEQLSGDRAASVREYLVAEGVPADMLVLHAYGESRPVADNRSETGRAKNRRVELIILSGEK